jgi:chaperonin GroES
VFVAFVPAVIVLMARGRSRRTPRTVNLTSRVARSSLGPGHAARPGRSPQQEEERMKIRPLHDRLLVERLEEKEVKKGGIIIPDTAKEKPQEAKVIAVGNGKVTDEGKKIPLDVKAGDKILFGKYSGSEVKLDDKEYLIMREEDVLAILE